MLQSVSEEKDSIRKDHKKKRKLGKKVFSERFYQKKKKIIDCDAEEQKGALIRLLLFLQGTNNFIHFFEF